MPTYDYLCNQCGHSLEIFQGINDPVKKKCPECGKNALQRQFGTGAAIVFKGSGFYQTDYRSEGYKQAAKAEKKASSDSAGKDSAGKDSAGKSDTGSKTSTPSDSSSTSNSSGSSNRKTSSGNDG